VKAIPCLSVVINTFNRAGLIGRAIDSVLTQDISDLEVIVLDDGSTDDTPRVVGRISDPRLRYVWQANAGLAAARNAGAREARGRWLAFLDDDDFALEGWAETLTSEDRDENVAVVCAGVQFFTSDGSISGRDTPHDLGSMFNGAHGLFLAGSFAVRRELFEDSGGFLAGMPVAHQTELGIRLATLATEQGLRVVPKERLVLGVVRRPPHERPVASPQLFYYGARWLLERHSKGFAGCRVARSDCEAIVGVSAARLGLWDDARRYLFRSALDAPARPRAWARLMGSLVPLAGARYWRVSESWAQHSDESPLTKVPAEPATPESLFLPWRYQRNSQASADSAGRAFWEGGTGENDVRYQDPVYRNAARVARRAGMRCILDVGCGSGHKLARHFGSRFSRVVGLDQASAISLARREFPHMEWMTGDFMEHETWQQLDRLRPELVLCADVIEHLEQPRLLLERLYTLLDSGSMLMLSTPDRDRLDVGPEGPPRNRRHVREWSMDGLLLLVEAVGFKVRSRKHLLPRRYSLTRTELNRTAWRALHLRSVPDRRSNLLLVLTRH
jgi:glycosyltransferase involved in cell wall biosynthesis/SAM-dependent methyltransferase